MELSWALAQAVTVGHGPTVVRKAEAPNFVAASSPVCKEEPRLLPNFHSGKGRVVAFRPRQTQKLAVSSVREFL